MRGIVIPRGIDCAIVVDPQVALGVVATPQVSSRVAVTTLDSTGGSLVHPWCSFKGWLATHKIFSYIYIYIYIYISGIFLGILVQF
jgi:hypothetical protein